MCLCVYEMTDVDDELNKLFAEMSDSMESIKERMKYTVEDELNKMKAEFNKEANDIKTIQRDYVSKIADIKKEHASDVSKLEQNYNKELQDMKSKHSKLKSKYETCEKKRKALKNERDKLKMVLEGNVTKQQLEKQLLPVVFAAAGKTTGSSQSKITIKTFC